MSKLGNFREILTGRNACYAVVAAVSMLAGCVATVRVPPPAVYVPPPPPPPPAATYEVAAPAVAVAARRLPLKSAPGFTSARTAQ